MIHVETIAARSRLLSWTIRPHRHRELYQLLLLWRGRVTAQYDEVRTQLRGPAFVVVPPLTVHSFVFSNDTDGLVATFAADIGKKLAQATFGSTDPLRFASAGPLGPGTGSLRELRLLGAMLLREAGRHGRGHDAVVGALLTTLVTVVLRALPVSEATGPVAPSRAGHLVERYRELIERDHTEHRPISAYAAQLRTSETALRRACRHIAGQSPNQMLQARTYAEAERLLRYTGLSVSQVAYQLGFQDPAYFSRFFLRRCGRSPRSFRCGVLPRQSA